MNKWIEKLFPVEDLYATVRRFPLSVVCALGLFIIGLLLVHEVIDDEEWLGRVAAILGCCYFWFGIATLIAESRQWNLAKHLALGLGGAAAIAALIGLTSLWGMHLLFLLPALLLLLMVAPYLSDGDDMSAWFFNRMLWFGVLVSYAALIMFAGGLSVALLAVHTLFDVDIDEKVYGDIWLFASLVLGPLYALSWVPKKFTFTKEDCNDPPGMKFIANWISAPMIFVYLLIIYAYFLKILITGDVPNGHLAYMISGFAGAGIATYLKAWPLREEGSLQLKLFYKIFFPALIIPVGFHFYAIWERVSAYGFTEQRYMLLLSAIWFAFLALGYGFKKLPIRFIPLTLAVLMALGSFGPWGGVSVSGHSQVSRLETLLTQNSLLADGKIAKAKDEIPFDDRKSISSILDYLCHSDRDDMIEHLFHVEEKKGWACAPYKLTEQLGFDHVSKYEKRVNDGYFNLYPQHRQHMDVAGYDTLYKSISAYMRANSSTDKPWKRDWTIEGYPPVKIEYFKDGLLKIHVGSYETIEIDMPHFASGKIDLKDNKQNLVIESQNSDLAYRLDFNSLNGKKQDGKITVENASFDFLYRIKNK